MARPTKLTPQLQEHVCRLVAAGVPKETAARASGLAPSSLRAWPAKGRKGRVVYVAFLAALKKAEAEAEAAAFAVVRTAAPTCWQAAAWVLERRWPQRYGRDRREIAELRRQVQGIERDMRTGFRHSEVAVGSASDGRDH